MIDFGGKIAWIAGEVVQQNGWQPHWDIDFVGHREALRRRRSTRALRNLGALGFSNEEKRGPKRLGLGDFGISWGWKTSQLLMGIMTTNHDKRIPIRVDGDSHWLMLIWFVVDHWFESWFDQNVQSWSPWMTTRLWKLHKFFIHRFHWTWGKIGEKCWGLFGSKSWVETGNHQLKVVYSGSTCYLCCIHMRICMTIYA